MKRVFYLLWAVCLPMFAVGQIDLTEYNKLLAERKYMTAWDWLEKQDPDNQNPEVFERKANHVQEYFAVSMMHQMFGLKDLEPGEDLMQLRRDMTGTTSMVMFNVADIGHDLLEKHPGNALIYRTLGSYHYEVYLKYGEAGMNISEDDPLSLAYQNFDKAIALGDKNWFGYYVVGYVNLLEGKMDIAAGDFINSIALNSTYAPAHYNLSYIYLEQGKLDKACAEALAAAAIYEDSTYKADAYRVAGVAAKGQQKYPDAIKYFTQSLAFDKHPATYNHLVDIAFAQKDNKALEKHSVALIAIDPTDQDSYSELMAAYKQNNALKPFMAFLEGRAKAYHKEPELLVLPYLYLAFSADNLKLDADVLKYYKLTYENAQKFMDKDNEFLAELKGEIERRGKKD